MRFLPSSKYLQNSKATAVYRDVQNRQRCYLDKTTHATSWEVLDLEDAPADCLVPLREIVMDLTTKDGNKLFCHVDFSLWDTNAVKFVYPENYNDEARGMIADLGAYVCFKHHVD